MGEGTSRVSRRRDDLPPLVPPGEDVGMFRRLDVGRSTGSVLARGVVVDDNCGKRGDGGDAALGDAGIPSIPSPERTLPLKLPALECCLRRGVTFPSLSRAWLYCVLI